VIRYRCARIAQFVTLAIATLLASCNATTETRYQRWLASGHQTASSRYGAFLKRDNVLDVVPMDALSRTSRRWRVCRHDEFSIPPQALWQNMTPTLLVVRTLRDVGIVDPVLARSVYRDALVNRCAGGSAGSKHRDNRAIDFDLPPNPDNVARVCAFWRKRGSSLNIGLGFYTPTAIHIDTAGFRTWGEDHHRATSLCIDQTAL
jgi:uncharacterized protein YcbK (DUF882 family)